MTASLALPPEISELHQWLQGNNFRYFSLNNIPELGWFGRRWREPGLLSVLARQFHRISPINFRRLAWAPEELPVDPESTTILCLSYLMLWQKYSSPILKEALDTCEERLFSLQAPLDCDFFAIRQNRHVCVSFYHSEESAVAPLWSVMAGYFFIKAYRMTGLQKYFDLAVRTGRYFAFVHPKLSLGSGVYFKYVATTDAIVYNVSAIISSFLWNLSLISADAGFRELALSGLRFITEEQENSGLWFYGDRFNMRYVDNFHTAFVLLALHLSSRKNPEEKIARCLAFGVNAYASHLFVTGESGEIRPRHFHPKWIPYCSGAIQRVDLRDAALAILLFSTLSKKFPAYEEYAPGLLSWTKKHMKIGPTYAAEITWLWKNTIPYLDFQSWMLLALATYYSEGFDA